MTRSDPTESDTRKDGDSQRSEVMFAEKDLEKGGIYMIEI